MSMARRESRKRFDRFDMFHKEEKRMTIDQFLGMGLFKKREVLPSSDSTDFPVSM